MEFTVEHAIVFVAIAAFFAVVWLYHRELDKALDALRDSVPKDALSTINEGLNSAVNVVERELERAANRTTSNIDDQMVDAIVEKLRNAVTEEPAQDDQN